MAKAEGKTFEYLDESHIDNSLLEVFDFDSVKSNILKRKQMNLVQCALSVGYRIYHT